MSDNAGMMRVVWLHLLKEGGRWTGQDLADELTYSPNDMHNILKQMAGSDYLSRVEKSPTQPRITYGVTPCCKVPRGITIKDILACDLVPAAEEAA